MPRHLILLDLIALTIFGEEHEMYHYKRQKHAWIYIYSSVSERICQQRYRKFIYNTWWFVCSYNIVSTPKLIQHLM
jgi:hypothetical protein